MSTAAVKQRAGHYRQPVNVLDKCMEKTFVFPDYCSFRFLPLKISKNVFHRSSVISWQTFSDHLVIVEHKQMNLRCRFSLPKSA